MRALVRVDNNTLFLHLLKATSVYFAYVDSYCLIAVCALVMDGEHRRMKVFPGINYRFLKCDKGFEVSVLSSFFFHVFSC